MLRRLARLKQWRKYLYQVRPTVPPERTAVRERCYTTQDESHLDNAEVEVEVKRRRGRPKKTLGDAADTSVSSTKAKLPNIIPSGLIAHTNHHDLQSFLSHAARTNLSQTTTVYKGTHYEYTVADALQTYGFALNRTGRSNDLGIDLVGTFTLPSSGASHVRTRSSAPSAMVSELRVIVQCKCLGPQPSMVRELEGAYAGAPAGWRGENVLALLVASGAATKGVRGALQRSRWPMALMQVTAEGWVRQFLWNAPAAAAGLEGLGVTLKYSVGTGKERPGDVEEGHRLALTWMGKVVESAS